jgi:hypothetical protein
MQFDCFRVDGKEAAETEAFAILFQDVNVKVRLKLAGPKFQFVPYCLDECVIIAPVGFRAYRQLGEKVALLETNASNNCGQKMSPPAEITA